MTAAKPEVKAETRRVFTNTRFPEAKMLAPNKRWIKFNSTKAIVDNDEDADFLSKVDGVYAEPLDFLDETKDQERFFTHKATGFKTLNKDAYEDWINRSEWSSTAAR